MAAPRRRLIRPQSAEHMPAAAPALQQQKLRLRREKERAALARWFARLKRAFHSVEKCQARLARIERQLAPKEN
jgi:hypothetical protein